jgi:hypothetical protein
MTRQFSIRSIALGAGGTDERVPRSRKSHPLGNLATGRRNPGARNDIAQAASVAPTDASNPPAITTLDGSSGVT